MFFSFGDDCPQLSCQLEGGAQGDGEEEAGDKKKEAKLELRRKAQSFPQVSPSGLLDARSRRNHGGWYGVLLTIPQEGQRLIISPIIAR